ncbi:hypothetical protein [Alicyclobacillus mengziensis]|uniref:hypothetical protein n=1 Tax=Alicyclobacillus mengziensis TaxID=2931921 RepID=UPI002010DA3D|nr:hypothetical protein [Alicyclobacillus mengziensis]
MMNYAWWITLDAVKGLTVERLDYRMDENANSPTQSLPCSAILQASRRGIMFNRLENAT